MSSADVRNKRFFCIFTLRINLNNKPMKRFPTTMILSVLLLLPPASAWSQNPYFSSRMRTIGVRLDGGVSMSFGSNFSNVSTNMPTAVQPLGSTGCYFNFNPRFRAGVDYNYTRMARQMLDGTLTPSSGGGVQGALHGHGPVVVPVHQQHRALIAVNGVFNMNALCYADVIAA